MSREPHDRVLHLHVLTLLIALLSALPVAAGERTPAADKLPRFASLRSDDVNLRIGPGENYPIEWVFKRKDMPVEIIEEFQNWRRVQDWQGDKGWVLDRMVSSKRDIVVSTTERTLHQRPDAASPVVARAEPGVVAQLVAVEGPWCRIDADGHSGWVRRTEVWGVYPNETLQ